jgi:hypothetical protein
MFGFAGKEHTLTQPQPPPSASIGGWTETLKHLMMLLVLYHYTTLLQLLAVICETFVGKFYSLYQEWWLDLNP